MQIVMIEPIEQSDLPFKDPSAVRVYFSRPSNRLSEVIISPCTTANDDKSRNTAVNSWKMARIHYLHCPEEKAPNFLSNIEMFLSDDLGISSLVFEGDIKRNVNGNWIKYEKTILVDDYINRDTKYTAQKLCDIYKAKPLGACLWKEIYSRNIESSHYRTFLAIREMMLSSHYKKFQSWTQENIFRNS